MVDNQAMADSSKPDANSIAAMSSDRSKRSGGKVDNQPMSDSSKTDANSIAAALMGLSSDRSKRSSGNVASMAASMATAALASQYISSSSSSSSDETKPKNKRKASSLASNSCKSSIAAIAGISTAPDNSDDKHIKESAATKSNSASDVGCDLCCAVPAAAAASTLDTASSGTASSASAAVSDQSNVKKHFDLSAIMVNCSDQNNLSSKKRKVAEGSKPVEVIDIESEYDDQEKKKHERIVSGMPASMRRSDMTRNLDTY